MVQVTRRNVSNHDVVWTPMPSCSSYRASHLEKTRKLCNPNDIFPSHSKRNNTKKNSTFSVETDSLSSMPSFFSESVATPQPQQLLKRLTICELQSIASKLEKIDDIEEATEFFKLAMFLAFSKTTSITNECCQAGGKLYSTNSTARLELQARMLRVTVLTSVLRTAMAIKYEKAGDYERAIACCSGGRQVLDRENIPRYAQKAKNGEVPLAGLVKIMLERLLLAEKCMEDRRKLSNKIVSLRQTIDSFNSSEHTSGDASDQAQAVSDTSIQLLSALTLEQNGRGAAMRYLEDALLIYKLSCENIDPSTGHEHSLLARLYRCQDLEKPALHHFEKAAEVLQLTKKNARALGSIMNDIAVLRMRRGEYGSAVHILRKSLWNYKQCPDGKSNAWRSLDSLQSWRNLGDCYTQEKEYGKAKAAYLQALNLQRSTRNMYDSILRMELGVVGMEEPLICLINDDSIADTFLRLGNACATAGSYQEALTVFTDALFEIHAYAKQIDGRERVTTASSNLLQVLLCAAEACVAVGQYARAICFYEEATKMKRRIEPDKSNGHDLGLFLAMCCFGVGNVHLRNLDYTEAHKNYSDAILHFEKRNESHSYDTVDVMRTKLLETGDKMVAVAMASGFDLARLEERATLEKERGELDQAVATLTEALMIRKTVLAHLKEAGLDSVSEVRALTHLLHRFGDLFILKGDTMNAERCHRDANKLSQKFGVTTSSDFFLRSTMPTHHLSLACYFGDSAPAKKKTNGTI